MKESFQPGLTGLTVESIVLHNMLTHGEIARVAALSYAQFAARDCLTH